MKTKLTQLFVLILLLVGFSASAQVPERVGWWKFDNSSDMGKAEIGNALNIVGTWGTVAGPKAGNSAISLGIGDYISMDHGISGNGSGVNVNDYTIQIDFSVPEIGIWHSFIQTDPANSDDADLFTNSSSNAIGTAQTTYSSKGVAADTWYRMVISVRNGEFFQVYVNGDLWLDAAGQSVDGRFSLASTLLLFADNDGDDGTIYCSEVSIWDQALDADQVAALGDAFGERVRTREKLGWWKFDDPSDLLKAEVGNPLVLTGTQESVPGPAVGNLATKIGVGSFLSATHDIVVNDGSTLVNEYSVQIDFALPEVNTWHAFIQTDPTNLSDADLFTEQSTNFVGTAQTGYSTNTVEANKWYRMVISVKNGEFFRVYLNGVLWLDAPGQDMDGRFGLDQALLFFADNDGDDGEIICSEISMWEVALTSNEVAELGYSPANSVPARVGWWKFDDPSDLLKAEIGAPLEISGAQAPASGPVAGNGATSIGVGNYLIMNHGISANGDGAMVNEYSLQFDFSIPTYSTWYSFFQTTVDNSDDADLFINSSANAIGTATTGYTQNTVYANAWYRMIVSVKNGSHFKIYINGDLWLSSAGQGTDGRWALAEQLLIFADNDGDDGFLNCSELGIWDVALNAEQAAKLGDATVSIATKIADNELGGLNSNMGQNYPNPFSASTTLPYQIQKAGNVSFRILDIAGNEVQLINEGLKAVGKYTLELNSNKLNNGVYYIQMNSNQQTVTRKMVVIK